MIKFEYEKREDLTFGDVAENQPFVDARTGDLCMKINLKSFIAIANAQGAPFADYYPDIDSTRPVDRILPIPAKITWEGME